MISSTIDMGVSRLPKLIKEISASVENLSSEAEVHLDYQINADVGTDNWIYAGVFQLNPSDRLPVNQGEVYQIRFRLRLVTKVESIPPVVNATVLEGFAAYPGQVPVADQAQSLQHPAGPFRSFEGRGSGRVHRLAEGSGSQQQTDNYARHLGADGRQVCGRGAAQPEARFYE